MINREKFLEVVSADATDSVAQVKQRIKKRDILRELQQVVLKVLIKLDELGWAQKDLARGMQVSPQQISKIVSGKENLTIETMVKLQNVLRIPVLASYYENEISPKDTAGGTVRKMAAAME